MPAGQNSHPLYVQIAVNVPGVRGVFDYHLEEENHSQHALGQLVSVPFGKQKVQGVIIDYPEIPAVPHTKSVLEILDPDPVVTPQQINLARKIALESLAPLGVTLHAMIPAGLSVRSDIEYRLSELSLTKLEAGEELLPDLSPAQSRLVELFIERGPLRGRQLDRALPHKNWRATAGVLGRRGVLESQTVLEDPSVKPKLERQVKFIGIVSEANQSMNSLAKAGYPEALARRQAVLKTLMVLQDYLPVTELYQLTGANLNDLKQLAKQGWVDIIQVPVLRDPLEDVSVQRDLPPKLTPDQENVWGQIKIAFSLDQPTPFLVHGVTGSGKTEIYLRAVDETLRKGQQAIILVPEIALTPQTVSRFMNRFPGQVGVLHSELSPGERYDSWRRARAGKLQVVVGPRSALFTPFPNLGLIVVDEFHDGSYYQGEIDPRYHAVRSAVFYADIWGAVCILGSATPDLTAVYESKLGKWTYLSLPQRILAHKDTIKSQLEKSPSPILPNRYQDYSGSLQMAELPQVELVDMRSELKEGNRSIFSLNLQAALFDTLDKNQQAILFLNRRGSATYVFCRDCGYALRCPRCDTSLTAHLSQASLRCHHCGYKRNIPTTCPSCGSQRIRHLGTGTEQVETSLQKLIPGVRTLRWDRDTTRTKGAHWEIMEGFSKHQADILIGTQMLAKGLDLPLVTLVGIVLGDTGLHLPDYRAAERTFQILTQVAGRAGRSPLGGKVILQTFDPENYVIQAAASHDYQSFYQQELKYRQELGYPPFARLVRLEIRNLDSGTAESQAKSYSSALKSWIEGEGKRATRLVGPTPPYFSRIRGEYRWQILIIGPDPAEIIRQHHPGEGWIVEVDPPVVL
jgi:primosomal protein N' (replication factor Y)